MSEHGFDDVQVERFYYRVGHSLVVEVNDQNWIECELVRDMTFTRGKVKFDIYLPVTLNVLNKYN